VPAADREQDQQQRDRHAGCYSYDRIAIFCGMYVHIALRSSDCRMEIEEQGRRFRNQGNRHPRPSAATRREGAGSDSVPATQLGDIVTV